MLNTSKNSSLVDGASFCEIPQSNEKDIDLAVKTAWKAALEAAKNWTKSSPTERSKILKKIADRIEADLNTLAAVET
jgi:aldehyde dehydrogenase